VGTVRALIRDRIAEWVSEAIQTVVYAGVAALVTAGGALGAGALRLIWTAIDLAEGFARTIRQLLTAMTLAGGTAAQLSGAIQQTAGAIQAARPTVKEINDVADELHAGAVIEIGKQVTGAEQEQRSWK
jgi:hypothetical protein